MISPAPHHTKHYKVRVIQCHRHLSGVFSTKWLESEEICNFIDIIRTFAGVTMDPITSLECGAVTVGQVPDLQPYRTKYNY